MRYKMFAAILALTVMSWAQNTVQQSTSEPQQSTAEKTKCPSCDKMSADQAAPAVSKDHACCAHHSMKGGESKETASCCSDKSEASCCGKDAKACMRSDKNKSAKSCCGDKCGTDKAAMASCCGGKCSKDAKECCSPDNKSDKTAKSCCGDKNLD